MKPAFLGKRERLELAQASHVVGHCLDFAVIQLGSYTTHLSAVATTNVLTCAFIAMLTEGIQLRHCVVSVLASQTWVLGWNASA